MEDKLLGIQIKGQLVKTIGNIYYIRDIEQLTIDTRETNRYFTKKDLLDITKENGLLKMFKKCESCIGRFNRMRGKENFCKFHCGFKKKG